MTLSFSLVCLLFLLWYCILDRPDIIFSRYFKSVFLLIWLTKILRIPFAIELNADLANEREANSISGVRDNLESFLERLALKGANGVFIVASAIADSIESRFDIAKSKIHLVPNGVDQRTYLPMDMSACRKQMHLPKDLYYVIYVGDFQRWQGVLDLVSAADFVRQSRTDVRFIFIGDGLQRPQLEKKINKLELHSFCIMLGWQTPEMAVKLIGASNICIAPYNKMASTGGDNSDAHYGIQMQRSPLKIMTYMSCGRPVIASHFAEAGVLVENYGAGIAVPPENAEAISRAILHMLDNPSEAEAMGFAGRKAVLDNFTWGAVAQKTVDNLEQIKSYHRGKERASG